MKNAFTYLVMVASTRCVCVVILLIVVSTFGLTTRTHSARTSLAPVQVALCLLKFKLCKHDLLLIPGVLICYASVRFPDTILALTPNPFGVALARFSWGDSQRRPRTHVRRFIRNKMRPTTMMKKVMKVRTTKMSMSKLKRHLLLRNLTPPTNHSDTFYALKSPQVFVLSTIG